MSRQGVRLGKERRGIFFLMQMPVVISIFLV